MGQRCAACNQDFALQLRRGRARHYEGDRNFFEHRIWLSHHGTLNHARDAGDNCLHLGRGDIFFSHTQHVPVAIHEEQISLRVGPYLIAGAEPAVRVERLSVASGLLRYSRNRDKPGIPRIHSVTCDGTSLPGQHAERDYR